MKAMDQKTYLSITEPIFAIVALLHLTRIFYGWSVQVGYFNVPAWISWIGLIAAGFLAFSAFKLMRGR